MEEISHRGDPAFTQGIKKALRFRTGVIKYTDESAYYISLSHIINSGNILPKAVLLSGGNEYGQPDSEKDQ